MKERSARVSQGCRRPKRRKRSLIRKVRPIANDPEIAVEPRRRVAFAGTGFDCVDIVDHGEVGGFRVAGDLDPDRRAGGIVGETDVAVRLPGEGCDLNGGARYFDAGPRPGQKLAAGKQGGYRQRNNRGQDLQTQHDTLPADHKPATEGLWLAEGKGN